VVSVCVDRVPLVDETVRWPARSRNGLDDVGVGDRVRAGDRDYYFRLAARGLGDLVSDNDPEGWLVAGFFTPDYRDYAVDLAKSLQSHGAPYRLFQRPKQAGGWEANTRAKPDAILKAMDQYPDQTLIWLDVDCTVHGDLSPLASLRGDVAAHTRVRLRQRGAPGYVIRSGTMVLKPNDQAWRLVRTWSNLSAAAKAFAHDQQTLRMALAATSGVTFESLPHVWCAVDNEDVPGAIIRHTSAGRQQFRMSKLLRKVGWRYAA
jgi:hypothetical protein